MRKLFLLLLMVITIAACSKFRKVQNSADWRIKYEAAKKYYDKGDYYKATILYEEILPIVRGLPEGEQVQFYYAYSHFHQGLYLLSSHYFKTFYQTYSRSQFAQEAEFMGAYSLYRDSPLYNLDQTSTLNALQAMQLFLNKHPNSEYRSEASEIIERLQIKLERKAYESAKQYHKLRIYKSALIAFENFRKDFPASPFNEEISFLKLDAQYELAKLSIVSKQEERYRETIKFYNEFILKYPQSNFAKQAKDIYEDSLNQLEKIAQNN